MKIGQDVAVRVFEPVDSGWVTGTVVDADGTLIVEIPTKGARFRCPDCGTIYYTSDATCVGGWPVYDPARPPGEFYPRHAPTRVLPDRQ